MPAFNRVYSAIFLTMLERRKCTFYRIKLLDKFVIRAKELVALVTYPNASGAVKVFLF